MVGDVICKRCSLCCHLVIDGRLSSRPCKFLVSLGNNRFSCRIYQADNRVGHDIGFGNYCHNRRDVCKNFVGCPYNLPEWGSELGVGDLIE